VITRDSLFCSLDPLRLYFEETITLELPGDLTVFNIDWFSVYDLANKENLGFVIIPDDPNVPPSLASIIVSILESNESRTYVVI